MSLELVGDALVRQRDDLALRVKELGGEVAWTGTCERCGNENTPLECERVCRGCLESYDEVSKLKKTCAYWVEQHGIEAAKRGQAEHEIDLARGPAAGQIENLERKLEDLQSTLHQRDTALNTAREALEWKINGFTLREYLKVQFPATVGHYPIEGHLDRLDHALSQIQGGETKVIQ